MYAFMNVPCPFTDRKHYYANNEKKTLHLDDWYISIAFFFLTKCKATVEETLNPQERHIITFYLAVTNMNFVLWGMEKYDCALKYQCSTF